jgi:hypothetical protein
MIKKLNNTPEFSWLMFINLPEIQGLTNTPKINSYTTVKNAK